MRLTDLPDDVLVKVLDFCNQADLVALAQTCRAINPHANKKLYEKIYVRRNPRLKSDEWFIDSSATEIAGLQTIFKRDDQNDYLVYLKLMEFQESLKKHGELVKEVIIYDGVFAEEEEGVQYLDGLVDSIGKYCSNLKKFEVHDERVKTIEVPSLTNFVTSDICELDNIKHLVDSLTIKLHRYSEDLRLPSLDKLSNLKELVLDDEEAASLRFFKVLSEAGLTKLKLKRLVFNHVHGLHDYNTVLRALTVEFIDACIDLAELEELEMAIGCQEHDCACLDVFLDDLAPRMKNLHKVSFHEKTFHRDHYLTEAWDVNICRFLINVPSEVKYLAVHHNPPIDGKLTNGLEGNYLRRRRLFETVVPKLTSLETFVSPTFLQSCACYEVLTSDLLWNGCECEFCSKFLPFYDKYLMDHAYYDSEETSFKDMISPRLFGVFGAEMTRRLQNRYDLDALSIAPASIAWGFHGYKNITCFNDVNECIFDENLFEPLAVCVSHFMLESVKFLVRSCPKLKTVALTGIFFSVDPNREIKCIYDTPERVPY